MLSAPRRSADLDEILPREDLYRAPVEAEEPWGPEGEVEPRFEAVRDVFAGVLREQRGTGAVAAWHDGRWVINLWGGTADAAGTRRWRRHSIVQPYSVTKPFAAMCALLLIDGGTLDLDAPMQRYVGLTREQQARAVDLTCFDDLDPTTQSDLYRHATTNPPGAHDPAVVNRL